MIKFHSTFSIVLLLTLYPIELISSETITTSIISELLRQSKKDNVVISPLLIYEGLSQLLLGSKGKTHDEIEKVLSSFGNENLNKIQELLVQQENHNDVILNSGSQIYANKDVNILPEYQKISELKFNSTVESVDFGDSANTAAKINSWAAQQTNNKITEIIKKIDPATRIMLVSAIYFNALWKKKFDIHFTSKGPFDIPLENGKSRTVQVDIMTQTDYFRQSYIKDLDADAIELPYDNSNISMIILLPRAVHGIGKVIQNLKKLNINEITAGSNTFEYKFMMPKFKFEFSIDLKNIVKSLGISQLFENANLENMTDYTGNLKVSEIFQKGVLEVYEAGATAAVVQVIKITKKKLVRNRKVINVNHPFVYLIKDRDIVYFAGHVTNPE